MNITMGNWRLPRFQVALCLIIGAAVVLVSPGAEALQLKLESNGGTTIVVTDNGAGDGDATVGVIVFNNAIDSFASVVAVGVSKPVVGDPNTAQLSLSGVTSTGNSGGTLTISLTDANYLSGTGGNTLTSAIGGTTDGTTTYQSYIDAGNAEFEIAAATVCTSGLQGPLTGAFNDLTSGPCAVAGDFAMTVVADIALGPNSIQSFGAKTTADIPQDEVLLGCRFTGGGVDTDFNWDHTLEDGEMIRNGAGNLPPGIDRAQFGGQGGASTGSPPQPKGEWQHHNQFGPSGSFSFHGGTASAAAGTEIVELRCTDPGYCSQARPAPFKQLDMDGIGTFSNLGKGPKAPVWTINNPVVVEEPNGKKKAGLLSYHWFEVNIDDLGEPGSLNTGKSDPTICPGRGFGEKSAGPHPDDPVNNPTNLTILPFTEFADCDCPDFYRITIYNGVLSNTPNLFLSDGSIDQSLLNKTVVLYEFYGFIDGGNLQIHPPTGFDTN